MNSLVFESMHEISARIAARDLSPVEVTEAALAQVETYGEALNAFITPTPELALEMARTAERELSRGDYRGPLHGIPVVLKDLLATRGVRTTGGSRLLAEWVPDADAAVVTLLRDAGAIFIGKTGMPEFAIAPTSTNPVFGAVCNPWNVAFDAGGSSSGTAAAVAAGMAWCGPGSDTGGSIRIPAAACGLVGLKPTWGRVSLRGVLPLCTLQDHVGPMARCVHDAALLMQALAGYDALDPFSRDAPVDDYTARLDAGITGLRVAVLLNDGGGDVDPEIREAFGTGLGLLASAGASLEEIELAWARDMLQEHVQIGEEAEAAADYGHYFDGREAMMTAAFRSFAASGLQHTAAALQRSRRAIQNGLHQVERAMEGFDLLVSPTLSLFPPPAGEESLELLRYTTLWDLNGWPAISVPVGLSSHHLPIGFQIVGRPWSEALLLRAARVIEQSYALAFPPPGLSDVA